MVRSRTPDVLSTPDRREVHAFLAATRPLGCARLGDDAARRRRRPRRLPPSTTRRSSATRRRPASDGYTDRLRSDDAAAREQLVTSLIALVAGTTRRSPGGGTMNQPIVPSPASLRHGAALSTAAEHAPSATARASPMRRPHRVAVRAFEVGRDEAAWLTVNNAAFSWHGEQGDWNLATLQSRISEPWFDPAGFLLHERDGRLAGFCWTKVARRRCRRDLRDRRTPRLPRAWPRPGADHWPACATSASTGSTSGDAVRRGRQHCRRRACTSL